MAIEASPLQDQSGNPFLDEEDRHLPVAVKAKGCWITDQDGRDYLDACSGAITTSLGHQHPRVKAAIKKQLDSVSFVYRTQFSSQAKIDLAHQLTALSGGLLSRVYFVGSGSEAVESCLKIALQYFWERGEKKRTRFVSLRPSYHGSTLGALGVTAYQPLEAPFNDARIEALNIESPNYYRKTQATDQEHDAQLLEASEQAIRDAGAESIAAIIVEPIGGASTGARVLSDDYLRGLRALCDRIGALLIFDEVLTGLGRTGYWFAYQHSGVAPDIMALGKGLGAGYYPMGAMLCQEHVAAPVIQGQGFMHGHTYAGNPMGCAVGNAVIQAIQEEALLTKTQKQGALLKQGLTELAAEHSMIGDVRGRGLLYGVEFVGDRAHKTPFPADKNIFSLVTQQAKASGLLVYPRRSLNGVLGDHILICPPLTVSEAEIFTMVGLLGKALTQTKRTLEMS